MTYLASVVSNSIGYLPATDRIDKSSFSSTSLRNQDIELRARQYKRDMILKNLIPCPKNIDIYNLRRFKDEYRDLLETFRNKVELLVLNPVITPESPLFAETLNDMKSTKEELVARMNESRLGDIIFVTVCGVISAGLGFIAEPTIGAIPGLLNAIYSACQIEKPENITDQTGLKYLALVDKRFLIFTAHKGFRSHSAFFIVGVFRSAKSADVFPGLLFHTVALFVIGIADGGACIVENIRQEAESGKEILFFPAGFFDGKKQIIGSLQITLLNMLLCLLQCRGGIRSRCVRTCAAAGQA